MSTVKHVDSLDEITEQIVVLREQGFVVVPGLMDTADCVTMKQVIAAQLNDQAMPVEFESDLYDPSVPAMQVGDKTIRSISPIRPIRPIRRLLDAYQRDPIFQQWAKLPSIRAWMQAYFGESVLLSRAHHNCVMTKHPAYGVTSWHRDVRYWSFERADLISVWFALGPEKIENGALWLVPKSHRLRLPPTCFDEAKFFRTDLPENNALIRTAVSPELNAGDVIFFHCNTLHSAARNLTDKVKFSVVFTYHGISNTPRLGTRSASKPEIPL